MANLADIGKSRKVPEETTKASGEIAGGKDALGSAISNSLSSVKGLTNLWVAGEAAKKGTKELENFADGR